MIPARCGYHHLWRVMEILSDRSHAPAWERYWKKPCSPFHDCEDSIRDDSFFAKNQVDKFYVGAALAAALGRRGNEDQGLTNDQPCRHVGMGEGQAQDLPLHGAFLPTIIWNKMPMCQAELNHPFNFTYITILCFVNQTMCLRSIRTTQTRNNFPETARSWSPGQWPGHNRAWAASGQGLRCPGARTGGSGKRS